MFLAYVKGPPVAVFAGSWLCAKSPIDGTPVALGEPIGDCEGQVARLISIATTVRMVKQTGARVFVSRSLGEDGVDAAFAGGADGVLEEVSVGGSYMLIKASDLASLVNKAREIAEVYKRPFNILLEADLDKALELGPYVDAVYLAGGWIEVEVGEVKELPEIGRCAKCGVDYLMYGGEVKRCLYCGRRLARVITGTRPPRSKAVFHAVYKKYFNIQRLKIKIV